MGFEFARRTPGPAGRLDWVRASIGALAGIVFTGLICRMWLGADNALPYLIAPMGASAVLLFAVPASPLAQPWPVIGGNTLSALAGIGCARLIGDPVFAAAVALALAIAVMRLTRCLHPPGGAVALTAAIGGPAIAAAGWSFALAPVALNSALLLAIAWLFNNAMRHSYPHRASVPAANAHGTADPPPQDRIGYTMADIDTVLARYDELLDVSRDDLDLLFRQVEAQAHRRLHRQIRCEMIMSRDVIVAHREEGVGQALDRLLAHGLAAMPVIDADGHVRGIVGHTELLAAAGHSVGDVMSSGSCLTTPETPIDELLPILSSGAVHEAIVIDAKGRLLGLITQTDLLAALWRGHVAEQVAATSALAA